MPMLKRAQWHKSITQERILEAVERHNTTLDNPGFCLACGDEAMDVEPDARGYTCDACDEKQVYGAEELLFHVA